MVTSAEAPSEHTRDDGSSVSAVDVRVLHKSLSSGASKRSPFFSTVIDPRLYNPLCKRRKSNSIFHNTNCYCITKSNQPTISS